MSINFRKETQEERRIRREQEQEDNAILETNVEVTGVELRSYQRAFFDATERIRIGTWGRRTGKTVVLNSIANTEAYNGRRVLYLVSNDNARLWIRNEVVNYNNCITLSVASATSICAQWPSTLILDEYQYMDGNILDALTPIMDNPSCRIVALSTNNGNDHLQHLRERDDSFFSSIPTTHPEVGIDLSTIIPTISSQVAQQEFLNY